IHAGSIRVTAVRRESLRQPTPVVAQMMAAEKQWSIERFGEQVDARRRSLGQLVIDLKRAGRRIVGYGAAGRSTILLNFCGLGPDLIDYVVDMSPLRYGKFVPGV